MVNALLPTWCLTTVAAVVSAIHQPFNIRSDAVEVLAGDDSCISNCSHMSTERNTFVTCLVEECKVLEKNESNAEESEVDEDMVYFETYFDKVEKSKKLALHFKWSPGDNLSVKNTKGYLVNVSDGISNYSSCYVITTPMEFRANAKDEFYNDCFGKVNGTSVRPGSVITVNVTTLPLWNADHDDGKVSFTVEVPNCSDKRIKNVSFCENARHNSVIRKSTEELALGGRVEELFCHNRSVKYKYHVSKHYSETADVFFCEYRSPIRVCDKELLKMHRMGLQATLYNISLPSSANLSLNYSIILQGTHSGVRRSMVYPKFSKCIKPANNDPDGQTHNIFFLILVVGIFCFVGVMTMLCYMCREDCLGKFLSRYGSKSRHVNLPDDCVEMTVETRNETNTRVQPSLTVPHVRVYVVFMPDHEYHEYVVHCFCSYLKEDLGVDVRVDLWENRKVSVNSVLYMKTNLKNADKVIVICSEGTKNCFSKEEYDGDMFTPVVRDICQKTFIGEDPGKFLVGFFDYSRQSHVPELLNEQCKLFNSSFKLMKQFEQLYFRLVNIQRYQHGGICRIEKIAFDRYYDPALTKHGKALKEGIDRMKYFVEDNPTWYTDQHGSDQPRPSLLPPLVPRPIETSLAEIDSISYPTVPDVDIVHVDAAQLPDSHSGSITVPKVPAVSEQPNPAVTQHGRHQRLSKSTQCTGWFQPLISVTSTSTESSFFVSEMGSESLSMHTSGVDNPKQDSDEEHLYFHTCRHAGLESHHSFQPESFQEKDFASLEGISMKSRLLSEDMEITRIGMTPSMERVRRGNGILFPFLPVEMGEDCEEDHKQLCSAPRITRAIVEDDIENIEEYISNVNQSVFV